MIVNNKNNNNNNNNIKASPAAVDSIPGKRADAQGGEGGQAYVIVCIPNLNLRVIFETLDKPLLLFVNIFFY